MATSTISRRSIIHIYKDKTVTIGTSATQVAFNYSVPNDYSVVCASIYHSNSIDVVGGMESFNNTKAFGFYNRASGSISTVFHISAIAIPNELLNSISVS